MTDIGSHAGAEPGGRADTPDAAGAGVRLRRHERALRQSIARAEAYQARSGPPCADGADPPALAILRGELAETERALLRVADGAYGRCTRCGQPIAPARLRVVPSARCCDACARGGSTGSTPSAAAPRHMPTIYGEGHPSDERCLV